MTLRINLRYNTHYSSVSFDRLLFLLISWIDDYETLQQQACDVISFRYISGRNIVAHNLQAHVEKTARQLYKLPIPSQASLLLMRSWMLHHTYHSLDAMKDASPLSTWEGVNLAAKIPT